MEKSILFSTEMIQAILNSHKIQTRRLTGLEEINKNSDDWKFINIQDSVVLFQNYLDDLPFPDEKYIKIPYQKGDIFWIKEMHYRYGKWIKNGISKKGNQKWKFIPDKQFIEIRYFDNPPVKIQKNKDRCIGWYKRNSIFMPKEITRIWLKIINIRAERLQNISEYDCLCEGIECNNNGIFKDYLSNEFYRKPYQSFQTLWVKINGKESWNNNPLVWKIEFKQINKIKL